MGSVRIIRFARRPSQNGRKPFLQIEAIRTNWREGALWQPMLATHMKADHNRLINLYPDVTYQPVMGFGGAFTEAAGATWLSLTREAQDAFVRACFGAEGLQYTLGRAHMGSCDFSLGNYACLTDPADEALTSFCMVRDEQYLLPLIRRAQAAAGGQLRLLLSPWSPPPFMKSNGEMNRGGTLLPQFARLWARCIAAYVKRYRAAGAPVTMLTVQNEPEALQTWDSCVYTARDEGIFVSEHLGPVMQDEGLADVQVLIWDHNKDRMLLRATETLGTARAARYVTGVAFHWYTGDHFENVAMTAQRFPDLTLLFTEGCVEYSRFSGTDDVQKAEMYAHDIMGNLNAGMHGFIDWNLLLDAKGGPNHVGNYCDAPIMATGDGGVALRASYYYIGHFSRYIRPGATRIGVSRFSTAVEATAFQNPDGGIALVLLNRTEAAVPLFIGLPDGEAFALSLGAREIVTASLR
jgi:glucosylceramidase